MCVEGVSVEGLLDAEGKVLGNEVGLWGGSEEGWHASCFAHTFLYISSSAASIDLTFSMAHLSIEFMLEGLASKRAVHHSSPWRSTYVLRAWRIRR